MGYDQRQNSDDQQVVDVGEQALRSLFSWRKKVLCISRDWPTLLQPRQPPSPRGQEEQPHGIVC